MKYLICLALLQTNCGSPVRSSFERAMNAPVLTTTAKGVTVKVEKGASVTPRDLEAIDAGIQITFDKSHCAGYTQALDHRAYTVVILQLDMIFTLQAKVKLLEQDNAALRAEKEKENGEQPKPTEI